ncbi:MAG TPA: hypothetical protein VMO20_04675 [Candidatus Acidoferrum sp.]|nr:hypothetical protein [Candidatus Acidoferrum sp.]
MLADLASNPAIAMFMFLFVIFAILMLPFASVFLSAKLRARLGLRWVVVSLVVLLIIVPSVFALIAPGLLESPYIRFQKHSQTYYSNLARACNTVLAEHPVGTNKFIEIPVTDPSLPKAITDLHPIRIKVGPQGFWMLLISDSRAGIGVGWGPQWDNTNLWVLGEAAESLVTDVYTNKGNVFSDSATERTSR